MSLFSRITSLFRSQQVDQDIEDELRSHLEMRAQDNRSAGMSKEDAELDARRRFGNSALIKESSRAAHFLRWLEILLQDLRYGWRTLQKAPVLTAVTVFCLGVGIGANSAIFSVMDTLLFREAKVADPGTLVSLYRVTGSGPGGADGAFPFAVFDQIRKHNNVFLDVAAWRESNLGARVNNGPVAIVRVGFISSNYHALLGVQPWVGRTFTPDDERDGPQNVAMISYRFWQKTFGGSPAALDQVIHAKKLPFKIVGVVPPGFTGLSVLSSSPDVVLPLAWYQQLKLNDDATSANLVARLKSGVSLEQASAEVNVLFRRIQPDSLGSAWQDEIKTGFLTQAIQLHPRGRGDEWTWQEYRLQLFILLAVAGLVLSIACANVANLLLARATARQKEIATRLALGAGRSRVLRQLFTESLLMAVLAGALGVGLALAAHRALIRFLQLSGADFSLNWRVLSFATVVSLVTGILFGLAPAWQGSRLDLLPNLKDSTATGKFSPRFKMGEALVVLQVTLSFALLMCTGLLVKTLRNLNGIEPGFDRQNLVLFWVFPTMVGYEGNRELALYQVLQQRLSGIPGVQRVSMARHPLMQGANNFRSVSALSGEDTQTPETRAALDAVAPGFFTTMRVPLLAGRDFSSNDGPENPKVAIIDQSFATSHFGNQSPLGKQVLLQAPEGQLRLEVIGVVPDLRYYSLRQSGNVPREELFLSYRQAPRSMLGQMCFIVRTISDQTRTMELVSAEIQRLEKGLPIGSPFTQMDLVKHTIGQEESMANLTSLFSGVAVLLACIGLYGMMLFIAAQRTREIGIRLALGANRRQVCGMLMHTTSRMAFCGILLGIPVAFIAAGLLRSVLYGVTVSDIPTLVSAAGLATMLGVAATYLPARRASRMDPMIALRAE